MYTKGKWTMGWGDGITGPTTPSVAGPTCREAVENKAWLDGKGPPPLNRHTIVSESRRTIAIIPFQEGENGKIEAKANARLIASAPALLEACKKIEKIEDGCLKRNVGYDPQIHRIALRAIAKATKK